MAMNSKTNKPIDPKIVAKRIRLKKRLKQMYLFTCIYMDTCTYCESEKITHCLLKGSLIQGYEELPICKKCAEIIDKSNDHYWDSNLIVDLIDLTNPSNNFSWRKESFGKV